MKIISLVIVQVAVISSLVYAGPGGERECLRPEMRFAVGKINPEQEKIERMGVAMRSFKHGALDKKVYIVYNLYRL